MGFFPTTLILATLLCSLVAGFLFAFSVVVMPGIKKLNDREYLRAFQVMDGIIQNNQPLFIFVWVGSVLALIVTVALGMDRLDGVERMLIVLATVIYLLGVQLPTITVNVPLNNRLQTLDVDAVDEASRKRARAEFESRWNRWNKIRTVLSSLVSLLLIILVFSM